MALTIPVLDAPRVQGVPLPTPFQRPDAAAGGAADLLAGTLGAAEKLGEQYRNIQQDEKKKADALTVREALNQQRAFNDAGLERVKRAEGKNAAEEAAKFYADADAYAKKLYGGLANDEQRLAFTSHANEELITARRMSEAHVGQQINATRDAEFKATVASAARRGAQNAELPDVVDGEAVKVSQAAVEQAKALGLDKVAAKELHDSHVSAVYLAAANKLYETNPKEAVNLLTAHADLLGVEGHNLLVKAQQQVRRYEADDKAIAIVSQHTNKDTTIDENAALADADKLPAGPERDALRHAIHQRVQLVHEGVQQQRQQYWDDALGLYMSQSTVPARRSVDRMRSTVQWSRLDANQQHALENMERADKDAARGAPLTDAQQFSLSTLENDIIDRQDYWGTAPERVLFSNSDFTSLPETQRLRVISMVASAHRDRQNPDTISKSIESTIRSAAIKRNILSGSVTTGKGIVKKFDEWPADDQSNWRELQDRVDAIAIGWKTDSANRGKRLPNALVEQWVNDVTRQGYIRDGGWTWFDKKVTPQEAAKRPETLQVTQPFEPIPTDDEKDLGRRVKVSQGFREDVTPSAFTPQALIDAAREYRQALAGPGPKERDAIVNALRAAGATNPEDPNLILNAFMRKRGLENVR